MKAWISLGMGVVPLFCLPQMDYTDVKVIKDNSKVLNLGKCKDSDTDVRNKEAERGN